MSNLSADLETVSSSCLELTEVLRGIENPPCRRKIIYDHISDLLPLNCVVPDFQSGLEWFNCGEPLSLRYQLRNKIVILDFFTYCCINCMHVLPLLKELEKKFSVEDGLVVVGVHSAKFENEKDSDNIAAAIQRYNITHPVVNDADGVLWTQFNMFCWPTLLIIGPQGQPFFQFVGEGHEKLLFECVEATINFFRDRREVLPYPLPITMDEPRKIIKPYLSFPGKVACTSQEDGSDIIAISNTGWHTIYIVSEDGWIKHVIGDHSQEPGFNDGDFSSARFHSPQGVTFLSCSVLYVADTGNHAIRKVDLEQESVSTVAGNGTQGSDLSGGARGAAQVLSSPWDLCIVRRPTAPVCICPPAPAGHATPPACGPTPPPPPPPASGLPSTSYPPQTNLEPVTPHEEFNQEILLIAMAGTHQIWGLFLQDTIWWKGELFLNGSCAALAGSGREENRNNSYPHSAAFAQPSGLSYCPSRKEVFVADSESSTVRCINTETGKVSPVVGASKSPNDLFCFGDVDGCGFDVRLQHPLGITWDEVNNCLYVADSYNHKVKKILPESKTCSSLIGSGLPGDTDGDFECQLNEPGGLCMSSNNSKIYIADTNNHCIKIADLSDGTVHEFVLHKKRAKRKILRRPLQKSKTDIESSKLSVRARYDGTISLLVNVALPLGMKLTSGAPQQWTLELPDSNWRCEALSGSFDPSSTLALHIKLPSALTRIQGSDPENFVFLTLKLFLCDDGTCKPVTSTLSMNVSFHSEAPDNVFHEYTMLVQ